MRGYEEKEPNMDYLAKAREICPKKKECPNHKDDNSPMMSVCETCEINWWQNEIIDSCLPIVANLLKKIDDAQKCDWCGSTDLVCGKVWKEERDGLKKQIADLLKRVDELEEKIDDLTVSDAHREMELFCAEKRCAELEEANDKLREINNNLETALEEIRQQSFERSTVDIADKVLGTGVKVETPDFSTHGAGGDSVPVKCKCGQMWTNHDPEKCNGSGVKSKKCAICGGEGKYWNKEYQNVLECPACGYSKPKIKSLESIIEDGHNLSRSIRTYIKEIAEGMKKHEGLAADDMRDDDIYNQALNDLVERI